MSIESPVMAHGLETRCLCGAVHIRVAEHRAEVGVCHCSRCRRWTGSALFAFLAKPEEVTVEGPVRTWSHDIAERAFCGTCGTLLWLRSHGDDYEFQVGLFDAAREFPTISEIYVDDAFSAVSLEGDHKRATKAEFEARNPTVARAP